MQSKYTNVYDRLAEMLFYHAAKKCGVYGYEPIITCKARDEMAPAGPEKQNLAG